MPTTLALAESETRFVEGMGLHFEALGAPRIGGRIFGLLLVAPRPLRLDEIAAFLRVSRASVSTNTRRFIQLGVVAPHAEPGDRRRYYVIADNAWDHRLHVLQAQARNLAGLVAKGRAAIAPDNVAAASRLRIAEAFAGFLGIAADDLTERWRSEHTRMAP